METSKTLILLFVLALAGLTCAAEWQPKVHVVGGIHKWAPNVNYTVWASNETFYVGDWLTFFYHKGDSDVVQVNETDYVRCSPDHPLKNDSTGNRYAFQLNNTGPHYFICSHGQCWSGMKLAVNVQPLPSPAPAPAPSQHSASEAPSQHSASEAAKPTIALLVYVALAAACSFGMNYQL